MTEEGKITMSEFKTVVERFEDNQKKIVEYMQHEFGSIHQQFGKVNKKLDVHDRKFDSLHEQIALLHEGQTAIRAELRHKPSMEMFGDLDRRVTRLENRANV
ncbi:hypothetical protein K8S19_05370 [bacterium]|nr:hypothetical protein [bacterium]